MSDRFGNQQTGFLASWLICDRAIIELSRLVGKPTMWFPNRSDTNRPVQSQKMDREAGNFGFRKSRNCTIHVAKTKALISFAVTAKLICAFGFAYANIIQNTNQIQIVFGNALRKLAHATYRDFFSCKK